MTVDLSRIADGRPALIPIVMGVCVSCVVCSDPYVANELRLGWLIGVPFVLTAVIGVLVLGVTYVSLRIKSLCDNLGAMMLLSLILSDQLKGLVPGIGLATFTVLIVAGLAAMRHVVDPRPFRLSVTRPFIALLTVLFVAILLSFLNGGDEAVVAFILRGVRVFLVVLVVIDLIESRKRLSFFLRSLFVMTTVSAVLAIAQEALYLSTGVIFPPPGQERELGNVTQATPFGVFLRVSAFSGFSQDLANTLGIVMAISFFLLIYGRSEILGGKRTVALSLFFMSIAFVLTFTKGAWVSLMLALYIGFYLGRPQRSLHYAAATVAMLLAAHFTGLLQMAVDEISAELSHIGDLGGRVEMLTASISKAVERHPYIGAGFGTSNVYVANANNWPVHNTFAEAFAELGVVGLTAYSLLHIYLIARLLVLRRAGGRARDYSNAFLAGYIAVLMYIQLVPFLTQLFPWVFTAFLEAAPRVLEEDEEDAPLAGRFQRSVTEHPPPAPFMT